MLDSLCSIAMLPNNDEPESLEAPAREPDRPERSSARGPKPLPSDRKRLACVSVRLNTVELTHLDRVRGGYRRGEWLRMAALTRLPPTVPAINSQAWGELARLAANFNQAQAAMNRGSLQDHDPAVLDELKRMLADLRRQLIGASR